MDDLLYREKQLKDIEEYEAICRRCGRCCGSDTSDPCINLKEGPPGIYYCADYKNRLGTQVTVSGRHFTCVPIREIINKGLPYEQCGYKC